MRYVLAILALAISGVLLLLGIGQRTFLSGPSEITSTIGFDGSVDYAIIDGSELSKVPGQANIVMRGSTAFAAVAKTRDAKGWLTPFTHAAVTIDSSTDKAETKLVPAVKPTGDLLAVDELGYAKPIDPRGNDLWLQSRSGEEGAIRLPVALKADQSIVLAGDGETPIPQGAAIVWVQDRSTPWAGPLLVGGGAFALLGAVLYIIAFDRDKRALGPRRGRRGPLIGVQNVVRGRRSHAPDETSEDTGPRRGGLTSAPALPPGKGGAGAAAETGAADTKTGGSTQPDATWEEKGADHAE